MVSDSTEKMKHFNYRFVHRVIFVFVFYLEPGRVENSNLSDSEDEEFIPVQPSGQSQSRKLPKQSSLSRLQPFDTEDSMDDEFDLRGKIHMNGEI